MGIWLPFTATQSRFSICGHNQARSLPDSGDRFYPRWSRDGRYLAATADDSKKIVLFDFETQKWVDLTKGGDVYYPSWSRDGQHIYFIDWKIPAYSRVRIRDHRVEKVVANLNIAPVLGGTGGGWVALAPDDSPIAVSSGAGFNQVYAFDWAVP